MSDFDPLLARSMEHKIGDQHGTTIRDEQTQLQKMGLESGNVMPRPQMLHRA